MSFVVGILMFLLVLNCLLLILLVLVQLPKKDAGAGMAFGGGTADALFGAGSGNALTKITKYTAVVFLALALFLGMIQSKSHSDAAAANFSKLVEQKQQQATAPAPAPEPKPQAAPSAANSLLSSMMSATNAATTAPGAAATNSAKPAK
jgi:preprotein translocase subunit SecG